MTTSYAHGTSSVPLIGQTIGDLLDDVAARFPTNDSLVSVFENRRFTYAEFLEEVTRVARALMGLGVGKGRARGHLVTNCVEWVLAQFATAKIGAVLVTLNPAYRLYELDLPCGNPSATS